MNRKKIVAGNWKMNKNLFEGKQLIKDIIINYERIDNDNCEVIIAPPFIQLELAAHQLKGKKGLKLSAQNCHQSENGAFTGEVSALMLKSVDVDYVILGHSERRAYFGEDEALLTKKINAALAQNIKVIYCVGEKLDAREAHRENEVVKSQIEGAIFHLSTSQIKNVVIAYEPVWAIGTGQTATADQAQKMHAFIRSVVEDKFGKSIADDLTILYGGSCKPSNANEIFACPDVDGGLIGGASLNASDFIEIVKANS